MTTRTDSPESLSRQAYRSLEELIVTLKLSPGSLVTERQLIDLSGHGRTPVREAIQRLEWQGLLAVRPRVGLLISEIDARDYRDIMAVRRRLEPLAASLVATHADDCQRERLIQCAAEMGTAAARTDILAFLAADKRFDEIVEEACPNQFLTSSLAPLQTHARRLWFSTSTIEGLQKSAELHLGVIRAMQQRNANEAAQATEQLLNQLGDLI
ncbi:GntR family transcriptional regulator [Rhizobium helianthi]|uniref:GntR family transcriptional regulator n=1 Tax=Rhizobium helianthi TaxID=1132695 RepID=A0ABW4M129_9HYPH